MKTLTRFLLLCILSSGGFLLRAGNFAAYTPADSIFLMQVEDIPGYALRASETEGFKKFSQLNWKELILQFYQIGLENTDNFDQEENPLELEELKEILARIETRSKELTVHFNGDAALSIGNFKETVAIFRANEKVRETLALTYGEELDQLLLNGEELTEAQQAQLQARLEEETRLDLQEATSLLSQFVIWADVKESEQLETKLAQWMQEIADRSNEGKQEPILGVKKTDTGTYSLGPVSGESVAVHWAVKNNVWVIAFSSKALEDSLNRMMNPPVESLATRETYREAVDYIGNNDFMMYLHLSPVDALIRDILSGLPQTESEPIPFFGKLPTGKAFLDWLELDALLPYVLGSRLEKNGVMTRGRYGFSRETALSRMFLDPDAGLAEVPPFVHSNFDQFASFNWHLGSGWSRMEKELMGIVPQAAAALGLGRMMATGQIGFDIKLQFMDHLDGNIMMVQQIDPDVTRKILESARNGDPAEIMKVQMEHPTGGQNYLWGMGMANEAAIREAFDRLMTRFHPQGIPEPVPFEGHELFYPIPKELQGGLFQNFVSYTFLDGYFLLALGDDHLLKDAVTASKNPEVQLVNNPDFKAIRALMPEHVESIEYTSGEQAQKAIQMVQASMGMLAGDNPDIQMPDLSEFAELFSQTLMVSVRNGLVFEVKGLAEFPKAE